MLQEQDRRTVEKEEGLRAVRQCKLNLTTIKTQSRTELRVSFPLNAKKIERLDDGQLSPALPRSLPPSLTRPPCI